MCSTPSRNWVLLWAAIWFGLVVPFHQRGQIGLPGQRSGTGSPAASCCARAEGEAAPAGCHESRKTKPARPSPGTCAVCFMVAQLDVPPAVTEAPVALDTLEILNENTPLSPSLARGYEPYLGRAPPCA